MKFKINNYQLKKKRKKEKEKCLMRNETYRLVGGERDEALPMC